MTPLYAYSLLPVLSVSLLLLFTTAPHARHFGWGLPALCACLATWSGMLLLTYLPELAPVGLRMAACGAFVSAGYLHLAWDVTDQPRYRLVWLAYAAAAAITAAGAAAPGLLYDPVSLRAGPMFWPAMALALAAATLPMYKLGRAWTSAQTAARRRHVGGLIAAGVACYLGAWGNALLLSHGAPLPFGLVLMLGALLALARVVSRAQPPGVRRLLEGGLGYSALTALLWATFWFGGLSVASADAGRALWAGPWGAGALFLFFMAAIAFEPLRQLLGRWLGERLFPYRARADRIAQELAEQEARSDQAERLAELGAFTSAIAHEVRNPLGVMRAQLKLLARQGAPQATLEMLDEQLDRASRFVDELVDYGRPRPLELRQLELEPLLELAASSARQGRAPLAEDLELHVTLDPDAPPPRIEADPSQLLQVLIILLDNAILALHAHPPPASVRVLARALDDGAQIAVEDSGPGVPPELADRLFEPFVTGRKRDDLGGTGLGLAIAQRIVERHGGHLHADEEGSSLGGARFVLWLPRTQPLLAAALTGPEDVPEAAVSSAQDEDHAPA